MVILIPALLSLFLGLAVLVFSRRPRFRYLWLVSAGSALVIWLTALAGWMLLDLETILTSWSIGAVYEPGLALLWDPISSSLTVAVATLLLAGILVDVQRASDTEWHIWGTSLLLSGIVMIGVLSGNLFTLVLAMGILDLLMLGIQLLIRTEQEKVSLAIKGFLYRGSGILFIYLAAIMALGEVGGTIESQPELILALIILAFFLRLGLLPLPQARLVGPGSNSSSRTTLSLAPMVLALILILRLKPQTFQIEDLEGVFAVIMVLGLIAAWGWLRSKNEQISQPLFLAGAAVIALAAGLRNEPEAGLIWSLALLLSGAVLFLFNTRKSWFILLPLIGFWGLSGLPLSASWGAVRIYSNPIMIVFWGILVVQGLLLSGYLTHTLRLDDSEGELERWERLIYPLGMALLPLMNLVLVWLPLQGVEAIQGLPWWPGFIITAISLGIWWLDTRGVVPELSTPVVLNRIPGVFSAIGREFISWFGRIIDFISFLLEGEGGVLWALLFLALMITIITQIGFLLTGNGS